MSRIVAEDFIELNKFIKTYSLLELTKDAEFIEFVSECHKKYYSCLVLSAELKKTIPKKNYSFILESNSDIAIALFQIFNGSYKSSKLMLRSSIETFMKGFTMTDITDIDQESSIYKMFERIKELSYFNEDLPKAQFDIIHGYYKELCKDVHSASDINMEKISALNLFPKYSRAEADKIRKIFSKLIPCYITLLCHKYNDAYHKIHHTNKEIVLMSILKKNRPIINNISA